MTPPDPAPVEADVAIVGYGPVGRMLALLLGRRGHRVVVVERQAAVYPLPRAVHFDDEIGRILQSVGARPDALSETVEPYDDLYEWRAADRSTLLRLDWRGQGPSGWHVSNFFHQPSLEARLNDAVEALESVTLLRGRQVVDHTETDDGIELVVAEVGGPATVRARYVIGADGANSLVRSWIGTEMTDLGYFHDWLVVDLRTDVVGEFHPPAWQLCDPARPTTLVPGGPGRRRFEFMRLPEESIQELNREDTSWRLLEPWGVTPDNSTLERHTVYTFQARWCTRWRRGRLLLAGDSAHLMPPFAGQGMCSGLRDAVNLAWKLGLVLDGTAPDALLDTYGSERAEHVRHFIAASMELGEVICTTDVDEAAARDVAMRADLAAGRHTPPRPLPRLGPGLHRDDAGGGTLSVQAEVTTDRGTALLDDVTGHPGQLIMTAAAATATGDPRAQLGRLGVGIVVLGRETGSGQVVDTTGGYGAWLDGLGACAALVRPDLYVFGIASTPGDIAGLVDAFVSAVTGALIPPQPSAATRVGA